MSKSATPGKPSGEPEIITILLVDDIPETRENIKKMIAFEPDLKVIGAAGTGREGVALAKELRPNISIMYINMPAMDGWEFLEKYDKLSPEQKASMIVVMLTTSFNPEDELKASKISYISSYQNKPLTQDILMEIFEEHFGERGS